MSALNKPQSLSFDEYLDLERHSETKHEYVGGYIHAMAGASEVHNRIAGNLFFHLRAAARGGPCGVLSSSSNCLGIRSCCNFTAAVEL